MNGSTKSLIADSAIVLAPSFAATISPAPNKDFSVMFCRVSIKSYLLLNQ